jgi:hypothetical protein
MIDFLNIYLQRDQPMTCPKCGTRTDFILDLPHTINKTQVHKCLSSNCQYEFATVFEIIFNSKNFSEK